MTGLRQIAREVLEANWCEGATVDGVPYAYTRPSRERYPEQFFWDSCLIALAWSRLDPARARAELRSLVAAQRPDGHIGHTIFWRAPVRLSRTPGYNVMRRSDRATWTIQPPLLAWAWAEVADRSPDDPGFREEGIAPALALHRWLERERADDDGLLGILQPDESGLDATPAYDAPLGRRAHPRPGFLRLVRANRRRRFSYRRAVAEGDFHATDVLVNSAWSMAWSGLARLGHAPARDRARQVADAMVARLLHDDGLMYSRGPGGRPLPVATWASLAPLAMDDLPDEVGHRMVRDHLLDPARFWLPYPIPSTSAAEPAFRPGAQGWPAPRYWRGPTWLFTPSFVLPGLLRLGYRDEAAHLVGRSCRLVADQGLREYYDPYTGAGLGARRFSVSAVVVDLAERVGGGPLHSGHDSIPPSGEVTG
ncbi:MAG: hypothetical protein AB7V42_11440 [Thermoleophilia bacterium]